MDDITYDVTAIKQHTSECMQTAAAQMLIHFDPTMTVKEVIEQVPVYVDEKGEKIGTSPGHLAAFFTQKGYKTTTYIFDTELFDRTWLGLDAHTVVSKLKERQIGIPSNSWLFKYHSILVSGWELYAQSGGGFDFSNVSTPLLRKLLDKGPFLLMVNSSYLNREPKKLYNAETDTFVDDTANGRSLTHATTCAGYKRGKFLIVDPDPPEGTVQHRWVEADHLIASIMSAQTESDNVLISVESSI